MADDLITSTQPGDVGNLLGDDIGGLDHYSASSPFQSEPLQPQPSAPQPMSNASKPLVDDFGFDSSPHISTTTPSGGGNPANPTGNSAAAPNSSPSFTPGELSSTDNISNHPVSVVDHDDAGDYIGKHHHHYPHETEEKGNHYQPDDDDDGDDGYDDREEELEALNGLSTNYEDNPAFSDSNSPSEVVHHPHPRPEASPGFEPPVAPNHQHQTNDALIGGYESDEHDYNKYDDDDDNDVEAEEQKVEHSAVETSQHPPLPHHQPINDDDDDDDDECDSLTADNVDINDVELEYSTSPATTNTNTVSSAVPTTDIIEDKTPFEPSSLPQPPSSSSPFMSSETPSPFSSSVAPAEGADVLAAGPPEEKEAAASSSHTDLLAAERDLSPAVSPTVASVNYAPPSPSAPPDTSTFTGGHDDDDDDDDGISAVTSQIIPGDDDDAAGFAGADSDDDGRISPAAAAASTETIDDLPKMSSSPQPLIPQPSAPPHPVMVESDDHFRPPSNAPQPASSTLHNSHGARDNHNSFESESFSIAEQTSPIFTDQPKEVQPKPTLEGPWLKNIDPKEDAEPEVTLRDIPGLSTILDLIYWRDVKKTGVVFGSMLFILLSLAIFSVLSVVAYLSLAILSVTLSFRIYKNIMQAVQKSGDGHPFKEYLEWELEMNDQKTQKVVKLVMKHFNSTVRELRRLFLVEDLVDSIKFGLLLWVLTYIGSWFNGMTLIINCVIIVFTLPKIYETNKVQIDNYLAMARSQFNKILQQVQSKLPFLKKKAKAQ